MRDAPEPDVFHDVPAAHDLQLLMDHGNALIDGVPRILKPHGLSVDQNFALVRLIDAERAFHKRGFARAVFTHHRVHGSGANG